jgi:hypothetical protein
MVSRRLVLFAVIAALASSVAVAQGPNSRSVKKTMLEIPATGETIETALALQDGESYLIEAQGIYTYAPGNRVADAEFAYDPDSNAWSELGAGAPETVEQNLDLLVNGVAQDWLGSADGKQFLPHTYSQNHVYRLVLVGNGQPISFRIYDTSHDWNEGSLTVSISRLKGRLP